MNNTEIKSPPFTRQRCTELAKEIANGDRLPIKEEDEHGKFRIYFIPLKDINDNLALPEEAKRNWQILELEEANKLSEDRKNGCLNRNPVIRILEQIPKS